MRAAGAALDNVARYCSGDGFVTSTAWGYRTRAVWEYLQALPHLTLKPTLAWSQDAAGYAADGPFSEGAKPPASAWMPNTRTSIASVCTTAVSSVAISTARLTGISCCSVWA